MYGNFEEYVEGYIEAILIELATVNSLLFGKDVK